MIELVERIKNEMWSVATIEICVVTTKIWDELCLISGEKQVLLVHILNEKWFILKIPILRAPISICRNKTDRNKSITTSASLIDRRHKQGGAKYSSKSPSAHLCYKFLPTFFCFELLLLGGPTFLGRHQNDGLITLCWVCWKKKGKVFHRHFTLLG